MFGLSDISTAAGYLINKQLKLSVLDSVMCLLQHHWSGLFKRLPYIIINPHLCSLDRNSSWICTICVEAQREN